MCALKTTLIALNIIFEIWVRGAGAQSWVKSIKADSYVYEITRTWDGDALPDSDITRMTLSTSIEAPTTEDQLVISVEAPFYDDPHIDDHTPMETMWALWEYEVVELYLLGSNDHYIEIQLSPKGQYILLELKGYRNIIRDKMTLYKGNYVAKINSTTNRWTGRAVIPNCYLPQGIRKFNAYAIHGSGDDRIYKSLFPANKGDPPPPDFHILKYFGDINFDGLLLQGKSSDKTTTFANSVFILFFAISILADQII